VILTNVSNRCADVEVEQFSFPQPVSHIHIDERPMLALWRQSSLFQAEGRYEGPRVRCAPHPIGPVMFLPAGRALVGRGTGGLVTAVRCRFDNSVFAETIAGKLITEATLERGLNITLPRIHALLQALMDEMLHPRFGAAAAVEGLCSLLLAHWARDALEASERLPGPGAISRFKLGEVEDLLSDLSAELPTIGALADLCSMKIRSFSLAYRRQTGRTIRVRLAEAHLARAQHLLLHSDLALKEIAFRLGFSSAANFSTAFRAMTGLPPGTFRKAQASASEYLPPLRQP
jgi:AraC family transcriptional regulator